MSKHAKLSSWQQLKNFGKSSETESIDIVELPVQKLVHEQSKVEVVVDPPEEKPVLQKLTKKSKSQYGIEG